MTIARWESLEPGAARRARLSQGTGGAPPITTRGVLERWLEDPAFVDAFREALLSSDGPGRWPAYFWETPPLTVDSLDAPFEFVVLPAPELDRMRPEPTVFREHFRGAETVATFRNLSGDATLVAPRGEPGANAFPHLAAFARDADDGLWRALWRAVAEAALERASVPAPPIWISTSGLGVAWLHVRLDDRPKYYQHAPYRER